MKTINQMIAVGACLLIPSVIAQPNFPSIFKPAEERLARLTIKVHDDTGQQLEHVQVNVSTFDYSEPGEGFGVDKYKTVSAITDTNGLCNVELSGKTGRFGVVSLTPPGFYHSDNKLFVSTNSGEGKWQPWNALVEIELRRILNPIPMYAGKISESIIPQENTFFGFDLMEGDWVAPHGKGKVSDLLFKLERKPMPAVPNREIPPFDITFTIAFSNEGDGIQSVFVPLRGGSSFRLPRQAPIGGYESVLVKHQYKERNKLAHSNFHEDQNYFFRIRTKKDANGNITSALYGKIEGDFNKDDGGFLGRGKISFTYYLNPEPNSRNMEFDPKKNLFKNLDSLEQVTAP